MEPKYFESQYPADSMLSEIQKALGFIKTGASCQIVGLPGVGKSVLLRILAYNRKARELHLGEEQKQYHFVYMDFLEVKDRSLLDVTKFILISLSYSLNERGMLEEHDIVNNALKEAIDFQDELILFQALKRSIDYLATEKGMNVIFLFDRFDQYTQDVNAQFFANLKLLRNRAKFKFSCVFTLARPLDLLVDPATLAEYYEFVIGNTIFFPLHQEIVQEFRLLHIEHLNGKSNPELKKKALETTGGHAKLLKISYEALITQENPPENITEFLLGLRQVNGALHEIWGYVTGQEKMLLRQLTQGGKVENGEDIKFLNLVGLVKEEKIAIPLFEEYLRKMSEDSDELAYDEERNEILRGDIEITDQLTPSEFRLLKHLIIHKGKVCEKDELINAIWKESITREGVTDQALDQIVYRLRKKIEADPNNPTLIQTIKGRGIKMV